MKKKILLLLLIFSFGISVLATDFTFQKLPNGQNIIIKEIKNNPIVTIDTWVKTGSINENDNNNGVAHFLEHLFFKGTKKHPTGEFDKILESKGAIINAATSKDFTHYYITIPSEHFETALELHSDMLLNPQIPRKELEKERKVVIEEIAKDGNNPSKLVYDNLNKMMYSTHPYKRKVIGNADIIGTIRREEILEYYNEYYTPSNMTTLIVGDIDSNYALQKVQEYFNQPYKKFKQKTYKRELQLQNQKKNVEYADTSTGYMLIGFRSAKIQNEDVFALDILAEILGGGNSSKLYRIIKEQKGLAFSISASNGSYKDDGIFYISSNFIPTNLEKLEKSIFEEINYIQQYGVTEEELQRAKNKIIQDTYYSRESTSDIATELGYIMTLTNKTELFDNYIKSIEKVTLNDIQQMAKKYLGINKSAISIVLPKVTEEIKTNAEIKPTAEKISETDGTQKYMIDNGTTLLVNENKNNNIIAMTILAKGGEFLENIIGEGTLTAATLLKGTKKYSAQELAQILEENGIQIDCNCLEDYFIINVQTTTAQLDKTIDILDEIINNATFDEYELEKKRSEILNKIKQKRDIPMNIALENFKTAIYPNSVYSNSNKILEKTLPQIDRNNVMAYYNKILDSKNIIVSVNGDVNAEKIINAFGTIIKDKKQPIFDYSKYKVTKLIKKEKISQSVNNLQTSWLFLGWQTCGVENKKDFITLKVINTILGSGLSSRLYRNLREQDGLAYQLGSSYSPKKLGGIFMTYIGTNPKTLEEATSKLLNEINRLKIEFVTDSELLDAKERLKGGFVIGMETNAEKASNIALFEAYGFGYNFIKKYSKLIDEITVSDIISVSNKYFNDIYIISDVK